MNILIDIGHPAHVHLFRNLHSRLIAKGHNVIVAVKNIPTAFTLLDLYKINYLNLGEKPNGILKKIFKQFFFSGQITKLAKKNKIDLGMGISVSVAQAGLFSSMKTIIFDDDDFRATPVYALAAHTLADQVLVPDCSKTLNLKKIVRYAGYHELAYLHPNVFSPDAEVLKELGIEKAEKFFLLRFNAFKAHHDIGKKGLSLSNKLELIHKLEKHGKVFISGEANLEEEFIKYRLTISLEKIHSVLYFATMLVSDSQTMSSEAALMGTPSIRMNSFVGKISYLEEQEHRYQLTFGFTPENETQMFLKIDELLAMPDLKAEWQKRRQKMLNEKIDVTAFLVWFVENYPDSIKVMRTNPEYQNRFR